MMQKELYDNAVALLRKLVAVPSFSKEEENTALVIMECFAAHAVHAERAGNNVFVRNKYFDSAKPTILLNSHHDTVRPAKGYTLDPFEPVEKDGKLFGLGSNDAGASLVSLIAAFMHFYVMQGLKYNLVLAASAEEEISGVNGIESLLPLVGKIDFGIVGEPTNMEMAVAERGLLVIDCIAEGRAGHVALDTGENALYKAMEDIHWIRNYSFNRKSELLGETKMTVTVIETANKQHNVIPSQCSFVIDARVNELYSFEEILEILRLNLKSSFQARSTRLKSTTISTDHPIVKAGTGLGISYYGSLTMSDKALMPFPALKMGPGSSTRSHIADEFIYLHEIENGIGTYIKLLQQIL